MLLTARPEQIDPKAGRQVREGETDVVPFPHQHEADGQPKEQARRHVQLAADPGE